MCVCVGTDYRCPLIILLALSPVSQISQEQVALASGDRNILECVGNHFLTFISGRDHQNISWSSV